MYAACMNTLLRPGNQHLTTDYGADLGQAGHGQGHVAPHRCPASPLPGSAGSAIPARHRSQVPLLLLDLCECCTFIQYCIPISMLQIAYQHELLSGLESNTNQPRPLSFPSRLSWPMVSFPCSCQPAHQAVLRPNYLPSMPSLCLEMHLCDLEKSRKSQPHIPDFTSSSVGRGLWTSLAGTLSPSSTAQHPEAADKDSFGCGYPPALSISSQSVLMANGTIVPAVSKPVPALLLPRCWGCWSTRPHVMH